MVEPLSADNISRVLQVSHADAEKLNGDDPLAAARELDQIHRRRRPSVAVLLLLRKTRSAPKLRPIRPLRSARPSAARSRQTQSAQSMGGTQLLGQILQQRDRSRDPGASGCEGGRHTCRKEILGRVPARPDARHMGLGEKMSRSGARRVRRCGCKAESEERQRTGDARVT